MSKNTILALGAFAAATVATVNAETISFQVTQNIITTEDVSNVKICEAIEDTLTSVVDSVNNGNAMIMGCDLLTSNVKDEVEILSTSTEEFCPTFNFDNNNAVVKELHMNFIAIDSFVEETIINVVNEFNLNSLGFCNHDVANALSADGDLLYDRVLPSAAVSTPSVEGEGKGTFGFESQMNAMHAESRRSLQDSNTTLVLQNATIVKDYKSEVPIYEAEDTKCQVIKDSTSGTPVAKMCTTEINGDHPYLAALSVESTLIQGYIQSFYSGEGCLTGTLASTDNFASATLVYPLSMPDISNLCYYGQVFEFGVAYPFYEEDHVENTISVSDIAIESVGKIAFTTEACEVDYMYVEVEEEDIEKVCSTFIVNDIDLLSCVKDTKISIKNQGGVCVDTMAYNSANIAVLPVLPEVLCPGERYTQEVVKAKEDKDVIFNLIAASAVQDTENDVSQDAVGGGATGTGSGAWTPGSVIGTLPGANLPGGSSGIGGNLPGQGGSGFGSNLSGEEEEDSTFIETETDGSTGTGENMAGEEEEDSTLIEEEVVEEETPEVVEEVEEPEVVEEETPEIVEEVEEPVVEEETPEVVEKPVVVEEVVNPVVVEEVREPVVVEEDILAAFRAATDIACFQDCHFLIKTYENGGYVTDMDTCTAFHTAYTSDCNVCTENEIKASQINCLDASCSMEQCNVGKDSKSDKTSAGSTNSLPIMSFSLVYGFLVILRFFQN